MSNLISCKNITKSFGAQTLFRDIDLMINRGDRIGLIGPNGSGKSTLLRIICSLEEADSGEVVLAKYVQVGYLAQDDKFDENSSVSDNLFTVLQGVDIDEVEKHGRVQEMLSRGNFLDPAQAVTELSGGWRKRLSICRALLLSPQVLVFDEPTNHLDIEGIIWLEKLLAGGLTDGPQAILMVSHDRQFLENCSTRVVELSAVYPGGSFQVNGNYSKFIEKREEYLQQQGQVEVKLSNKVRRETEWLRRGPKARTSKAKYRIDEAHRLQGELQEVKSRNRAGQKVRLDFDATGRKTKKLMEAKGLSQSYEEKILFSNVDLQLGPGSRVGLLGKNGCGKSSLINMLAEPDEWSVQSKEGLIRTADGVKIVHFDQGRKSLNQEVSLRRALAPEGDSVVFRGRSIHVVSWAKRFLFRVDQLETPVGELSGGEQARILLASLMLQPADILLLDEPTNDLDIASLDVLEESLQDFPGGLVLITHDRYLLDRICDNVLGFDGEGGTLYYADYQQWLDDLKSRNNPVQVAAEKVKEEKGKKGGTRAGRLSYMDQREYDSIEEKIMELEEEQEGLQATLDAPETASDPHKLNECWQKLEKVKADIEKLYARWDELETKKSGDG